MKVAAVILIALVIIGGALYFYRFQSQSRQKEFASSMFQRVEFKTKDNVTIVGDYYAPVSASEKGLLLLHMMPADRSSWQQFAEKTQQAGWHVLAIDLRGHGESQGGPNGYRNFSDEEHQASRYDVEAGVGYLKEVLRQGSGYDGEIYLGGASIGANLALQYLAEHSETKAAFLLSPGLDYKGIKTEALAQNLKSSQSIYYAASSEDAYSAESTGKLFDQTAAGVKKEIKIFDNAGHGTTIFEKEPQFMDVIVNWLQRLPLTPNP